MGNVRKSLALSFADTYATLILQFATSLVVSRLLTPHEIGIFSVAMVLVGFAHVVRDFGVGQYVVQERELTDARLRAAFTLTLLLSWSLALLVFLASFPAAQFYREPGVRAVMMALAGNFLLVPFGSVTMAYLRREMRFGRLFVVKAVSTLISCGTTIGFAVNHAGFMSLAWGAIAGTASSIVLVNLVRPRRLPWRPGFAEIRRVLSFGSFASGISITSELGSNAPDLIIGRLLAMESVALYSRATGLIGLFGRTVTQAVWPVIMPYFSAQHRAGADLKTIYLTSISFMSVLAWPFTALVALVTEPLIHALYGPQWEGSVALTRWLALSFAIGVPLTFTDHLLVSVGKVRECMRLLLALYGINILTVFLSAAAGLEILGAACAASACVGDIVLLRFLKAVIPVTSADLFRATRKSAFVTLFSVGAAAILLLAPVVPDEPLPRLVVASLGALVGWLVGIALFNHPLGNEMAQLADKLQGRLKLSGAK